jgi:hypothetical protein
MSLNENLSTNPYRAKRKRKPCRRFSCVGCPEEAFYSKAFNLLFAVLKKWLPLRLENYRLFISEILKKMTEFCSYKSSENMYGRNTDLPRVRFSVSYKSIINY